MSKTGVLTLLCVAQLMVVLDVSIVNVTLPSIKDSIGMSQQDLQWIVTAYGLTLGGFLLLGGRCADLLGRRRMVRVGVSLFTVSSLACGLAPSSGFLIVMRAAQGLGSAFTAPAALSLLTTVFAEGSERNKALGIWGALSGGGAAVGVLLGGVITAIDWRWIFLLNVPVGIAVVVAARHLPESVGEERHRRFDVAGAATVTSGLLLGVYAVNRSVDHGWTSDVTLLCAVASFALIGAFLLIESRAPHPLMPLGVFRRRSLAFANSVALLVFGAIFSLFFVLSLYMQQVLGYSPMKTGLAYLPLAITVVLAAAASAPVVTRIGPKPVLTLGMTLVSCALFYFAGLPTDASYVRDLLPGYLVVAFGLGLALVPVQVAAFSGVPASESGLAAGLINTSQEVGGAVMVAALATVAVGRTQTVLAADPANPSLLPVALSEGFYFAFLVAGFLAAGSVLVTLIALPRRTTDHGARSEGESLPPAPAVAGPGAQAPSGLE